MGKRKKAEQSWEELEENLCGESYYFIAGYTSGGAPFGITMEEERGLLDDEKNEYADKDLELPF